MHLSVARRDSIDEEVFPCLRCHEGTQCLTALVHGFGQLSKLTVMLINARESTV
ncbi:hypothetical protein D9M70_574070 [compost metagenome]